MVTTNRLDPISIASGTLQAVTSVTPNTRNSNWSGHEVTRKAQWSNFLLLVSGLVVIIFFRVLYKLHQELVDLRQKVNHLPPQNLKQTIKDTIREELLPNGLISQAIASHVNIPNQSAQQREAHSEEEMIRDVMMLDALSQFAEQLDRNGLRTEADGVAEPLIVNDELAVLSSSSVFPLRPSFGERWSSHGFVEEVDEEDSD